jgi:hypothetical protein
MIQLSALAMEAKALARRRLQLSQSEGALNHPAARQNPETVGAAADASGG